MGYGFPNPTHRDGNMAALPPKISGFRIPALVFGLVLLGGAAKPALGQVIDDYRITHVEVQADFRLTDPLGQKAAAKDFQGKAVLIVFGYTSCPDVCPVILVEVARMLKSLESEASAVRALFITLDPERDTPRLTGAFVRHFHEDIIGLTGSKAEIGAAAEQFGVFYSKVETGSAAGYAIAHTGFIYLVDRRGVVRYALPHDSRADLMLAGMKRLLAGG